MKGENKWNKEDDEEEINIVKREKMNKNKGIGESNGNATI